jgi:23S rRNA pseudouridine1911/1915/1917 synthase
MPSKTFTVLPEQAGWTLAAALRRHWPHRSWSRVRRAIATRHIRLRGEICLDPARRLQNGEEVEILDRPAPRTEPRRPIVLRYLDEHVVVVEKPSGLATVRHPSERSWPARRRALAPTLDEQVAALIALTEGRVRKGPVPRLRIVHRLDKETSGLVVFARTVLAERGLGQQFRAHTVARRYVAVVHGRMTAQRIASRLVRDRGDGRRGSTRLPGVGKEAVTHVDVMEELPGYTLVACRLETGRTHQIRIHLAERGHAVCGDKVYGRKAGTATDLAIAKTPRLALHATELGFEHPGQGKTMYWSMPLPADLETFLGTLRAGTPLS